MNQLKDKIRRLIISSERVFKTDMLYVVKNGSWSAFGQVVSIVISFAISIIFAHFLSKESYGEYKFILSITSVIGSLSLVSIGTAIIQAIAQGKERVLRDGVRITLRWGVIVTIFSFLIATYYFVFGNMTMGIALIFFGICAPITTAFSFYGGILVGRKDFRKSTFTTIFSQVILALVTVFAIFFYPNALFIVVSGFITSALLSFFLYLHFTKKYTLNNVGDDSLIRYGKHMSYMNFFGNLANQLDKILVFHWLGPVQLAIYSFAIIIPEQIRGGYKNIFGIALPKFSVLSGDTLKKSITDKIIKLTILSVLIVAAYYVVAPYFFQIFFPKYLASVWYSQVYLIGLIAIPAITLFSTYFQVLKDTKTLYKITIMSNVVTIIYSFALIYPFGLVGAVIENGLSWLTMALIGGYFFIRHKN